MPGAKAARRRIPRPCSRRCNSKVDVDALLHGVIIQSANDACIVLAEGIAGTEADFAAKLTQRAREIGLAKSVFTNSNGLPDPGTKVTTRELAMLARYIILNYPDFYPIFGQTEFTWNKIRQQNRNPLLPHGHRRRRAQNRLHQGSRLRPGRLGGAGRLAADRGRQRREDAPRSAPTKARSCSNGASTISRGACCSPKGRPSATPRCSGGATGQRAAGGDRPRAHHGAEGRRRAAGRAHRLYRPGAGAGAGGHAGRRAQGLAQRQSGAGDSR